jgi:hypothetical protein
MTDQIKNLAQENALLRADLECLPPKGVPEAVVHSGKEDL